MKRVYLAAFGSGMGHASRMSALAEELFSSGDKVAFSSSGEVTKWLRDAGYECNDLPLVDVAFTGEGAFSAAETLKFFPRMAARYLEQLEREVGNLARFAPDVVLSDSVAATVVASKLLRVRTVVLLNQIRLISSPRTPKTIAKVLSSASLAIGSAFWDLCEEVLIPDLPPPYTISERNLWSAGRTSTRARYIGFLTPNRGATGRSEGQPGEWQTERRRPKVFWQISGPPATRKGFLAKALKAAEALGEEYLFTIAAGNPGGPRTPTRVPGGYLYGWCSSAGAYIDSCDIVVSRAGHVSVSDYILRAKPSVLVPIQAQTEQMGNASKAQRLGIAVALEERSLEPGLVAEALREVATARFAERVREMKRVAEGFNAHQAILEVLSRT